MNETELLATLQVVFVLLCGVLVFSLVCMAVEAVREYHHKRVVRHHVKHSRGPEVPVSNMVAQSFKESEGATGGVEYTTLAPQGTAGKEQREAKQPSGYSRAPRKRHARHGR